MKRITIIALLILSTVGTYAQDIPKPMSPPRLVNDFAQVLSQREANALEQKLRNYHDTTSTQLYVVIVSDLQGYDRADFAFRIGEEWGVGQSAKDNGAVILVKPKVGNQRGEAFIATGYGLEDVIPDALASRIVRQEMIPYFQNNQYFSGINNAVDVMIDLASGKFSADQYTGGGFPPGAFFLLAMLTLFFIFLFNVNKTKHRSIGHNMPLWIAMGMLAGGGRRRSGGFGGFSSGSGGFGGFSGGGGGSFGGGGAGGSW